MRGTCSFSVMNPSRKRVLRGQLHVRGCYAGSTTTSSPDALGGKEEEEEVREVFESKSDE
jgi:hypothetical protein